MDILLPEGWKRPSGYSAGTRSTGTMVFVAGQIGWDGRKRRIETDDFVAQVRQALENIVAILRTGGAGPEHITRMTWYVTDMDTYRASTKHVGEVYRAVIGNHYPAMTLVNVVKLVEERAQVEIEATAVVP